MKTSNRYERYVIATRMDGIFRVRIGKFEGIRDLELKLCQHCFSKLRYKRHNIFNKRKIYNNFTLTEFFNEYSVSPLESAPKPLQTDVSAPINDYPKD